MSTTDPTALAEHNPLAHPAVASVRLFDYSRPPGDHLLEFYNALWRAVDDDFDDAPNRVARLMPRGHGKSEAACVVFPTWAILSQPDIRVAVISKTARLAGERTEKVVEYVERYAERFGVEIEDAAGQQLTTRANDHKEATIAPYGLESQLTGKHFDVIVYDDLVDWENQRTATQRRNVRNYFRDYTDNLPDPDSVLEQPVQAMIGTRKHPKDLYATDILESPQWDVEVYRAIHEADWPIVETRDWTVRGDDGKIYDSVAELPPDVTLAPAGVQPNREVRTLWPEHKGPADLLTDIVGGDQSTAIWQRENQQDPHALSGEVFKSEWLNYVADLPKPVEAYRWVAGLDLGLVDDAQRAVENDTDYTALAVVGWDGNADRGYLYRLERDRGLSVEGTVSWAERKLNDLPIDTLFVEQNANRGVSQRLRDDSPIPAEPVTSSGSKEERIHNLAADFESGTLRIVGQETDAKWQSFEQEEWLQFPNAAHDDRLDAVEIAMRAVEVGGIATGSVRVDGADEGSSDPDGVDRRTVSDVIGSPEDLASGFR